MHEPYSHTMATQHYLTDFWLCSHWSNVTPRTLKPPQRRQKTHSIWGCLPWFHRHHSLFSLGERCSVLPQGSQWVLQQAASPFIKVHTQTLQMLPQGMKEGREVHADLPPSSNKKGWIRPETTLQLQRHPFKRKGFFSYDLLSVDSGKHWGGRSLLPLLYCTNCYGVCPLFSQPEVSRLF